MIHTTLERRDEELTPYRLMSDRQLEHAVADLQRQVEQLAYLREPAPPALRAGLVDALDRARAEAERRGRV